MDVARPVSSSVASVSFSFLSTEDVRRISVKQIVNPVLLDNLGQPNIGGLYDPALGPTTNREICATCRLDFFQCPGHFGHIELPVPVYHPLFLMTAYKLLRCTCMFCHNFKVSKLQVAKATAKLRLLERGLMEEAKLVDDTDFAEGTDKPTEGEKEKQGEAAKIAKILFYAHICIQNAPHAKRGDYKDGAVFQARKAAIDDFMALALGSSKKCQRTECGAAAYTFRKEGHTKIVEYDLTPKQKLQLDGEGKRRADANAWDQYTNSLQREKYAAASTSHSDTDSASEGEENVVDDAMDTGEGSGDDTAEAPAAATVARAASGKIKGPRGRNERVLTPGEVRAHLRWLFRNEADICSLMFGRQGPYAPMITRGKQPPTFALSPATADMFFLDAITVSPTRFRPASKMADKFFEHPHNELLAKVIKTTYTLRDLSDQMKDVTAKGSASTSDDHNRVFGKILDSLIVLQMDVNSFIDSSKNTGPARQGKLALPGVKQGLEKKEGLFRMHMMGKRVNYAARSVISPDVNIETNEIGIPPIFARKLTFAEPVTHHNVTELRELVIRGPTEHPGARAVQLEDGVVQSLARDLSPLILCADVYPQDKLSLEQRTAIANQLLTPHETTKATGTLRTRVPVAGKKVLRYLRDGDILILNRQPTLHKPSMMAHKAKVLQGEKTIRMHYANCNSYNADFDGDEMNIHFPQGQIARSEAMNLANTDNQYLVPTSGKPLRGLIQDHVIGGLWLTNKSSFFTREEYYQFIYGALRPEETYTGSGRVITLPPAIMKPRPLWTGKQIISTILKNITPPNGLPLTMKSNAQVKSSSWGRPKPSLPAGLSSEEEKRLVKGLSEDKVLVLGGDLVRGVLDKSQFGAASYGLVHSVYEVYGAETAGRLLSIFSRLFTKYLQHRAFTCRMDDLALTPKGEAARKNAMRSGEGFGTEAAISFFSDMANKSSPRDKMEMERELNVRLERVLRDGAQMAGLDNIVKGKMTQLFEAVVGATIPGGLLKPFPDNHMQAMTTSGAKGSATNARQISALLGQQELESRRVPVMVSGKTLPAFRPFETAAIAGGYIGSRFLTGLKPQEFYFHCMAGREGLIDTAVKTSRSGYLQRCLIKHLEGIQVHYDHTVRGADSAVYQFLYGEDGLDVTKQMHLTEFAFNLKNNRSLATKFAARALAGAVDEDEAADHMKKVLKRKRKHPERSIPDPTLAKFMPSRYLGATSEKFAEKVEEYVAKNKNHLLVVKGQVNQRQTIKPTQSSKMFRSLMSVRYMRSLVEPGEAVGLLASQGVGEPSTQMTLNTFHFAGHGAANVTLGIPRLREIVMTAATNPKTPMIQLPIRKGTYLLDVERFCQQSSRLNLSHLVEDITVAELLRHRNDLRVKIFVVRIKFFPWKECQDAHYVKSPAIVNAITRLAVILKRDIAMEYRRLEADLKGQVTGIGKGKAVKERSTNEEEPESNEKEDREASEVGDGDADEEKRKSQGQEQTTYDEEEGDDADEENEDPIPDDEAIEAGTDDEGGEPQSEDYQMDLDASEWKAQKEEVEAAFALALPLVSNSLTLDEKDGLNFELEYEVQAPKIFLVDVLERACNKCVVNDVQGISKCYPPPKSHHSIVDGVVSGDAEIVVEGTNLRTMAYLAERIVNIDQLKTNNIHAVLTTYGVEAARATIVQEIASVFALYSINVNVRHLMLIADYMTFDGGFKPFNRRGISTHSSPLLKASFETTAAVLSDATLHGDYDSLTTPSGNIVVGRPAMSGTGAFDIVLPL